MRSLDAFVWDMQNNYKLRNSIMKETNHFLGGIKQQLIVYEIFNAHI